MASTLCAAVTSCDSEALGKEVAALRDGRVPRVGSVWLCSWGTVWLVLLRSLPITITSGAAVGVSTEESGVSRVRARSGQCWDPEVRADQETGGSWSCSGAW